MFRPSLLSRHDRPPAIRLVFHVLAVAATLFLFATVASCERQNVRSEAESPRDTDPVGVAADEQKRDAANGGMCKLVDEGFGAPGQVPVSFEVVADGLEVPWGVVFLEGGDLLVSERPGRLRLVRDGELVAQPLAELDVTAEGEGGMLDILAHPQFQENSQTFVYLTVQEGGSTINTVELWEVSLQGERPSASKVRTIVDRIPGARFHNGGRMNIGPDGKLYVGTGDAKEPRLSQDPNSLAGKILRYELDGSVPADNPFGEGNPAYITGIRNTQGWDWKSEGMLWITDHGPSGELGRTGHDEVSTAAPGANLGWPETIGCDDEEGMATPVLSWEEAAPPGGAAIYTGDGIPEWKGSLLVGTLGSRHLQRVVIDSESGTLRDHEVYFQGDPPEGLGRLRDVMMGPSGDLYVTTSNCDGRGTCPADGDKVLRIIRG